MWLRRLCFSLCLLLLAPAVRADGVDEYRDYVARGVRLFELGDYEAARESFLNAYEIHANPVLLFNIASTYRRAGDLRRAARYYARFIEMADPDDPRSDLARATLADMARARRAQLATDETGDVTEQVEEPEPEPEPKPEPKPKPKPKPKRDAGAKVEPKPEPEPNQTPTLGPARKPVRRAAHGPSGSAWRWTGGAVAAVGALGLGLGVRDLSRAHDASDRLAALAPGSRWNRSEQQLYEDGQRANRRGTLLVVAGGAAFATGVVLYVVGERRESGRRAAPEVAAFATEDAAGFVVTGTF